MDEMKTIYHNGKEYWYYEDDIISCWDDMYNGDTYQRPRYISAACDDGFVTIELDECGNVLDISNDF
jgi:hypothetical protein